MKIYLDTCSLQRPLDSKTQLRIIIEAEAVLGIVNLCETGQLELLASDALLFEIHRNQNPIRRQFALKILSKATQFVEITEQIEKRACELVEQEIKPIDALHLALAEHAEADYFCTCDDRLSRRAKSLENLLTNVVFPTELILEIEK
jgi:predicted nucleic acid-binding protein